MSALPDVLLDIITLFAWHRSVRNTMDELNFLCEVRAKIPASFLCPITVEYRTLLHVASPWYPGSPYVPMCTVKLIFWSRERFWICKYLTTPTVRNRLHTYRAIMQRRARAQLPEWNACLKTLWSRITPEMAVDVGPMWFTRKCRFLKVLRQIRGASPLSKQALYYLLHGTMQSWTVSLHEIHGSESGVF